MWAVFHTWDAEWQFCLCVSISDIRNFHVLFHQESAVVILYFPQMMHKVQSRPLRALQNRNEKWDLTTKKYQLLQRNLNVFATFKGFSVFVLKISTHNIAEHGLFYRVDTRIAALTFFCAVMLKDPSCRLFPSVILLSKKLCAFEMLRLFSEYGFGEKK